MTANGTADGESVEVQPEDEKRLTELRRKLIETDDYLEVDTDGPE